MGRGRATCSVPHCTSSNSKGFSLFRFPQDLELRQKWLNAIGRPRWTPSIGARVCELHFTSEQILSTLRLLPESVPFCYSAPQCSCPPQPFIHPSSPAHDHTYVTTRSPHCKIHSVRQDKIREVLAENCGLLEKIHNFKRKMELEESKENKNPKKKFSSDDIRRGLQLKFACNARGYRKVLEMQPPLSPLPSIRTLQCKIQHIKFAPGVLDEVFVPLQEKFKGFGDLDRDINIVFDELVTKKKVDYDASLKRYIGYGTLPGQEDKLSEKGEIYVFRAIHQRLKQIVAYHLNPASVNAVKKKDLIIELLTRARDMNANVISLVCDMGNRGLLTELGFSTRKDSLKWCIPNPVKPDAKLWCVPDPVHIFKAMKECLCKNKTVTLPQFLVDLYSLPSASVNVEHIEWLECFQRGDDLQLVPGLTLKDLNTSHFSKMKVRSSVKVLNPRTASALQYLVMKGIVPENFETTAWFIKLINRWFQLMSSRSLYCALGLKNKEVYCEAIEHLKLVITVFETSIIPGGWKPVQSHIVFATKAILEIQHHLLIEKNYQFLQTAAFSTDCVENINSSIRIQCPNPTPLEFKNRLKQLAIAQFQMKISTSSYDYDDAGDFVDLLLSPPGDTQEISFEITDLSDFTWSTSVSSPSHKDDVLYRVCGYTVFSLKKRKILSCDNCVEQLRHNGEVPHPNELFTILTDIRPGAQFRVCDSLFQMFRLIEFNLMSWASKLRKVQDSGLLITSVIQPGVSHISLPTCHSVREKLVKHFTIMRFKQIADTHFSPTESNSALSLSSKSAGSHYLAQNYTQKNLKRLLL
ncbi:Transposable element P transposase [Frankliniella fusca]|uniref:Transposable element P transposase n=1 Tax=Frankliniella fusca TaxID=407009 RepID=A0AAE1HJE1_9NEOP|nr:Transposable element P transposase [Frankliniella fusca]